MKYIKLIIITAFLSTAFTGCSYVSDMVEGAITKRASFSAIANYNAGNVTITWDKTDTSADFTGIEIYLTSPPDDEYATYNVVASRITAPAQLTSGLTTSYTYIPAPALVSGKTYFYRVGLIHWDDPADKRIAGTNGYTGVDPTDYNNKTGIDAISGYAKVIIP